MDGPRRIRLGAARRRRGVRTRIKAETPSHGDTRLRLADGRLASRRMFGEGPRHVRHPGTCAARVGNHPGDARIARDGAADAVAVDVQMAGSGVTIERPTYIFL